MSRLRFLTILFSISAVFVFGVSPSPSFGDENKSSVPARGYYKVEAFVECLTHDRTVWAINLGLPKSELNRYLDRKDKTRAPKDRYLKYLASKVKRNDFNTIKFPFRKSYPCPRLSNGHSLKGRKVCEIWTGLKSAGVKQFDNGGTYCEFQSGGSGIAAQPVVVCERYGKTKLGFNMGETSTFVRWNGNSYDAVCFYLDKLDVEATLKHFAERIEENFEKPGFGRMNKAYRISSHGNKSLMEEIYKATNTDFTITIDNTTPLVGKRIVELAQADPKYAEKYADWLSDAISSKSVIFDPEMRGKIKNRVLGHGYNTRLFQQTLQEIVKDRKLHRTILEDKYNDYFHEKDVERKKIKRDIYENHTKIHKALKNFEAATSELHKLTLVEKKKDDALAENKRRAKVKKRLKSLVGAD
ncbi:MAG: hypothetical protein GY927_22230 [bacterium]|nr:hypothetical protein [bacterium]